MIEKITSATNAYIKHLINLRKDKKYRKEHNSCLLIGKKMVEEVLKTNKIKKIITTQEDFSLPFSSVVQVPPALMKKITALPSFEEIAAEVFLPPEKEIDSQKHVLVLDQIKDPGNLGTLIRTAHGLGFEAVVITPNSVDPFNDKALRAAKGSTFFIPLCFKNFLEIEKIIEDKKYQVFLADLKGKNIKEVSFSLPLMLILSSESHGPRAWTKNLKNKISIPMKKDLDSFNVAISGAIIMYEIRRADASF